MSTITTFASVEDASVGPAEAQGDDPGRVSPAGPYRPPQPSCPAAPEVQAQVVRSRVQYSRKGRSERPHGQEPA
jgi:hypothetical protein